MKKSPRSKPAKRPAAAASPVVGRVTPKECDEPQALQERKNGLAELVQMLQETGGLDNNAALYEKVVADLGKTATAMQKWWSDKSAAYGWESAPSGHWAIDFDSREVTLNS